MIPHHVYSQLAVVGLLWLCVMRHDVWPRPSVVPPRPSAEPAPPQGTRHRFHEPTPCKGLTQRPPGAAWHHDAHHPKTPPPRRAAAMPPSNRRPWAIDPSRPFCPHAGCDSQEGPGLGNRRATGHPSGGLWRQCSCRSCQGYCLEAKGPIFHGKRLSVALLVRVLACLAAGLGLRATARVFEVDPTTVLQWWVAAAEQLQALTRYLLCDVHVDPRQLDAW